MTDTIDDVRAELARVALERDLFAAQCETERGIAFDAHENRVAAERALIKIRADLDRTRAELAAARAAMPTEEEYKRVADAFEGELMEAPKARQKWLAAGAAWFDRLDAYHAAHPAASTTNTTASGGDDE